MKLSFYVGITDSVVPVGEAEIDDQIIEIDLQDLIRVSVQVASQHVGEAVKLFIVASDGENENEQDFVDGDNDSLLD